MQNQQWETPLSCLAMFIYANSFVINEHVVNSGLYSEELSKTVFGKKVYPLLKLIKHVGKHFLIREAGNNDWPKGSISMFIMDRKTGDLRTKEKILPLFIQAIYQSIYSGESPIVQATNQGEVPLFFVKVSKNLLFDWGVTMYDARQNTRTDYVVMPIKNYLGGKKMASMYPKSFSFKNIFPGYDLKNSDDYAQLQVEFLRLLKRLGFHHYFREGVDVFQMLKMLDERDFF